MINGKRIAVVMPAYNAARTLEATVRELPEIVDERILVDDCSADATVEAAHDLGLTVLVHDRRTAATAATRRPATRRRWSAAPTWW